MIYPLLWWVPWGHAQSAEEAREPRDILAGIDTAASGCTFTSVDWIFYETFVYVFFGETCRIASRCSSAEIKVAHFLHKFLKENLKISLNIIFMCIYQHTTNVFNPISSSEPATEISKLIFPPTPHFHCCSRKTRKYQHRVSVKSVHAQLFALAFSDGCPRTFFRLGQVDGGKIVTNRASVAVDSGWQHCSLTDLYRLLLILGQSMRWLFCHVKHSFKVVANFRFVFQFAPLFISHVTLLLTLHFRQLNWKTLN